MANDYYTNSADPADGSAVDSSIVRAEHASIAAGFDKLMPLTGNGNKVATANSGATAQSARSLLGTANQVTVTIADASYTFSLPQNIHTTASPTFAGLTLTGTLAISGTFAGDNDFTVGSVRIRMNNATDSMKFYTNNILGMTLTGASAPAMVLTVAAAATFSLGLTSTTVTATGLVLTPASASGGAGLRVPPGTAPSAPTDGDIWTTTAGMFVRVNGVTVGPLT